MANSPEIDPDLLYTSDTEKTFQYQNDLPSLHVPSLQHTLDRYLDSGRPTEVKKYAIYGIRKRNISQDKALSVKPHVTDEEYRKTEFIVQQFASGVGKDLNKKLLEKAATSRNWLATWWEEYAYLDFRLPLAPFINFSGPGPYGKTYLSPKDGTQIERAASISFYMAKYWSHVRKERLRPDKDSKGTHLCMDQYKHAFSTCRIPAVQRDKMEYYFKTESEGPTPLNIVVLCKGRIFTMRAVDEDENPLTPPELQQQFQYIHDMCTREPAGPGVGALTGDSRTSWAKIRNRLIALNPRNYENLEEVQKSMFCVAFDDESPTGDSEIFWSGLAGNPTNRWFDKSLTLIFYKNGMVASNCDHSPYDAMVLVSSIYYVDLSVTKTKGKWQGSTEVRQLESPRELEFVVDDVILKAIDNSKQVFDSYAKNLQVCAKDFPDYGKQYLRKHKLHPDTHVQLALQYAYYKLNKKPAPTYETATIRKYYKARTETMRSCTNEALEWSKTMCDTKATIQEKYHLYMRAMNRHNTLMAEAQNLSGCDRHLLGLQIIAIESGLPMPQLYTDPSYMKSGGGGNFVLSTSFVGYTSVYGGVVPMVEHGYGSFYKIQPNKMSIFVSSWNSCSHTDATTFNNTVQECLRDMAKVIDSATSKSARL